VGHRSSDRQLDEQIVSGLIGAQFPDLAGLPVRTLGAGWDHQVFRVGTQWIFRFPRRAERVPWLTREIEINAIVAGTLGPAGPVFERIGSASPSFPYPFVGYRWLPGMGADQAPVPDAPGLAADIGRVLGAVHSVDVSRIPPTPEGWEYEPWSELRGDLVAVAAHARPLLSPGLLARAEPYLAGRVAEPAQDGPWRFIHNDICPDHLIVDPRTGRLAGLIDFTDAMVGEPALDFTGLIGLGGYAFIDRVLASYGLPLGNGFGAKLEWLTRTLTLTWLAETVADDPARIRKHLAWVTHAFANPADG
jgi:aminoglycoside phosphotransferase (APT) family kinase protein